MNKKHLHRLATELALPLPQIEATTTLLAQGGTVPFIARYRKEATGGLDEVAIAAIRDGGANTVGGDRLIGKTPGSGKESSRFSESPQGTTNKEEQYRVSGEDSEQ